MDTMLADLDFATAYLDDILIKSKNREDHAKHVLEVFKKGKEFGLKLNLEKCEIFLPKIKYLGQVMRMTGHLILTRQTLQNTCLHQLMYHHYNHS